MSKHTDQVAAAMQSKYAPLYHHLCERDGHEWYASFAEIEKILGFPLPKSARTWMAARWVTQEVNPAKGHLIFRRDSASVN